MTSIVNNLYNTLKLYKDSEITYTRIYNLLININYKIIDIKERILKNTSLLNITNNNSNVLSELYNIFGDNFIESCETRLINEFESKLKNNISFKFFLNKKIKFNKLNNNIIIKKLIIYCKRHNISYQFELSELFNQEEPLLHIGFKNNNVLKKFKFYINEKSKIIISEQLVFIIKFYIESLLIIRNSCSIYDYIFILELNRIINFLIENINKRKIECLDSISNIDNKIIIIQRFYKKYKKN
jgi:hypothetical protein